MTKPVIFCADFLPPDMRKLVASLKPEAVTSHYGGGTVETMTRVLQHSFSNIEKVERGEPLPEADLARTY